MIPTKKQIRDLICRNELVFYQQVVGKPIGLGSFEEYSILCT